MNVLRDVGLAIFAYDRPEHLERCLRSLMVCPEFDHFSVTVFCDGPKMDASRWAVAACGRVARQVLGADADVRESAINKGLARSIIGGVTELVNRYGRVVVVEDDLLVSPAFLRFMLEGLDRYETDERVYQISGHQFAVPEFANRQTAMLLPMTTTWGWGTWARAWAYFDPAAAGWEDLRTDATLRRRFNLEGVYDYSGMLERQMEGKRDSWGVRWYWSVFRAGGLSLFPARPLVKNIGTDGSGTHGRGWMALLIGAAPEVVLSESFIISDSSGVNSADLGFVRRAIYQQSGGAAKRLIDWLRKCLKR
jgi:hypothetical protein